MTDESLLTMQPLMAHEILNRTGKAAAAQLERPRHCLGGTEGPESALSNPSGLSPNPNTLAGRIRPRPATQADFAGTMICVWVTMATTPPSGFRIVVCHTIVVRPMCSGTDTARSAGPSPALKKLVLDSSVPVR